MYLNVTNRSMSITLSSTIYAASGELGLTRSLLASTPLYCICRVMPLRFSDSVNTSLSSSRGSDVLNASASSTLTNNLRIVSVWSNTPIGDFRASAQICLRGCVIAMQTLDFGDR